VEALMEELYPRKAFAPLIRIGSSGDGGYLVPDDLVHVSACFSPGVADVADFESALLRRGIPCFLADASVESPPIQHELLHFERRFLGVTDDEHYSTLDSWVRRNMIEGSDFILQMDIEGDEYAVLLAASPEILRRFRILVIEFHNLDRLLVPAVFDLYQNVFKKLLADFEVVHIHPNNNNAIVRWQGIEIPPVMEFSFVRKDLMPVERIYVTKFPNELDGPCAPLGAEMILPECWYASLPR